MTADQSGHHTNTSLLSRVNWRRVGTIAQRELKNREYHAPAVSAYRWWARRPHSVMGAILDAAVDQYGEALTVSDPFSGGGTVTFEAARRGLRAYAQDLYPWPARGLASALQSCAPEALASAAQQVLAVLAPLRAAYRRADGVELSHILRVRTARCLDCSSGNFQFPHPLVSAASRGIAEKHAWFGCPACGTVTCRPRGVATFGCDGCGKRWNAMRAATGCSDCGSTRLVPESWHAVLVQEIVTASSGFSSTVLRPVADGDPVDAKTASRGVSALTEAIQSGRETKRLLDSGFTRWGDLYTQRQANVLGRALAAIKQLDASNAVKDRLAFGVLGAAEMPAFISRWDRFALKPFEAMANHRYSMATLAVETNLLSPVGRGTLPRRLQTAAATLQWLIESCTTAPKVVSTVPGRRGRKRTDWDILIATGSSARQALTDASVSVVVTDMPYFEDVQYGELARLFHAWLKVYDPALVFDESQEAVVNPPRGLTGTEYERTITACLKECRRTLKDDGTLVLTFHNKNMSAWRALAGALGKAGFAVKALAVVRAENGGDHCKRNVNAMLHDLVLECVPAQALQARVATRLSIRPLGGSSRESRPTAPDVRLEFTPKTPDEMNLAAVGLALAECVHNRDTAPLRELYRLHLARWTAGPELIG
jgi:putative DNA methylase